MNLDKVWYLPEILSRTEREGLFILMESAGINIYYETRRHISMIEYPCLLYKESLKGIMNVCGCIPNPARVKIEHPNMQSIKYDELTSALEERIKQKSEQLWKDI